ncbi:MAG: arginase [Bacteroidota bacterium]|jgi:arginase|nr:arginase [Sphingobacteriales bacterium]
MRGERFKVITVESDFGAGKKGAALGPQALLSSLQKSGFKAFDVFNYNRLVPEELPSTTDTPFGKNIENIKNFQEKIVLYIQDILKLEKVPFIISGDHSSANALISGIKDYHANSRVGVIWIDAHADLHSPYTTPSGNVHGMPIAALMGQDHKEMGKNQPKEITKQLWEVLKKIGRRRITPKIQGRDIVFIALRSTETEEERIIAKEEIKTFRPQEIAALGIERVAQQTLHHLRNCDCIYVSFDVDSLDSSISSGTGTPEANGLSLGQATYLLNTFGSDERLLGLEITEINPTLDAEKPMQEVIALLLKKVFA